MIKIFFTKIYILKIIKKIIIKNCDNDKNYKITLNKFNQALVKHNDIKYWVEKYKLQNISDIDNIGKSEIKK